MHSRSVSRATLAVVAGGGLAALASAAALGMESPYFKVAIVGGVDAITIGLAGLTAPPASPTSSSPSAPAGNVGFRPQMPIRGGALGPVHELIP